MKILKYLVVFMAGVVITLLLTNNIPRFSSLWIPAFSVNNEVLGVLGVFALIILVAFLAATWSRGEQSIWAKWFQFLREFQTSSKDCWLGGICGGLGEKTPVPAWIWRLGFTLTFVYYGSGLLAYFLLWMFIPSQDETSGSSRQTFVHDGTFWGFLRGIKRSEQDSWIGGVCGGLGARTPIPTWIWRMVFASLILFNGAGFVVYLLMWFLLPLDEEKNNVTA